jgi:hypothetical protein
VNDTQARRHVSENVQHVGDLWTEANRACMCDAGGGLAIGAGPGHPCTLSTRLWSSKRLRAERSQRSITSSRCAGVSALRTPTRAWAEV